MTDMKTVLTMRKETVMKQFTKYICAFLMLVGINASAWGTGIYLEYNSTKYYDGSTITINLDYTGSELFDETEMAIKNDAGWTDAQYYGYGYIKASISGTPVKDNLYFDNVFGVKSSSQDAYLDDEDNPVSFYEYNSEDKYEYIYFGVIYDFTEAGTYTATLTIWQEELQDPQPTYQSATITLQYVVTAACTSHTIILSGMPAGTGTNGTFSADKSSACEDATVTLTATPSSGYELDEWTVNKAGGGTCDVSSNQFTMPDVNVTVSATFKAATYILSFNANGGSGTMSPVNRVYNSTVAIPANTFIAPAGKVFDGWATNSGGTKVYEPGADYTMGAGNATLYAHWRDGSYTDAKFSCADWSITGPSGDIVFITSTASKTVRSQEAFHVTASGLPANTALTFSIFPSSNKFVIKKADGTIPQTNVYGVVDADVYVFYTPSGEDTGDGLDEFTRLTVSVTGEPRTATIDTKRVIGRHLPADFVIAAKNTTTNKWYALPANMSGTGNPEPVEIAVDDINNPTIAYTAASNIYNLYLSADNEKVQLGMKNNVDGSSRAYALWANNADKSTDIGKNTGLAENTLGDNYKWTLTQTNTSITNPQDAKYTISNLNNVNPLKAWFAAGGGPKWGLYASGVAELRLIPASDVVFTEAEIVAWGHHNAIVEVDKANAGGTGVAAAKVKAKLNGAESSLITLTETGTSKGSSSKYNYTVAFGDVIDFAANEGQMLTLEWYNSSDVMIAVSNIIVPTIVASDITINKTNYSLKSAWNTEVHVLPNVTVTVDAIAYDNSDVTIKELNIYPGATVKVTTGTLKATTLVMRNGWDRLNGEKKYDVARLYITPTNGTLQATNAYADWYIDYDQYYPIAVPWKVATSGITYLNTSNAASSSVIKLRYYDGAGRVTGANGSAATGANWVELNPWPETLDPGKGYAMTARRPTGKAFSIVRMPLTIPSAAWTTGGEKGSVTVAAVTTHKDQVEVTAHGADDPSKPEYVKGWNFIANPYMSLHQGALNYTDEGAIEYANIPDVNFKEYDQVPIATTKLKPASGFLVQAPKTGTVTFGETNRWASAPSYRTKATDETPVQRAYITLANETNEDMMGLLIADKFTEAYETNADLEKLLSDGNTLRTYMRYGDMNMAYVAINETLAKEWIPVSVRIPADGEYTFSLHEASIAGELEGVYLIDYQNGDKITNLIEQSYTFSSTAGTINGRFSINAKVGERQTPTGIDAINAGGDINSDKPFKFIYHDKVYIWLNGVIYDTTGKRVK